GRVCLAAVAVAACAGDAAMAAPAAAPVAPAWISLRRVGRHSPAVMPAIYGLLMQEHFDVVRQIFGGGLVDRDRDALQTLSVHERDQSLVLRVAQLRLDGEA